MKVLKSALLVLLSLFVFSASYAQITLDKTRWSFEAKKTGENKYDLIFTADIQDSFHLNSLNPGIEGLFPPAFNLDKNPLVTREGKVKEKGKLIKEVIEDIGTNRYYEHKAQFIQSVSVKGNTVIKGHVHYQVCDHNKCLNKKKVPFAFKITDAIAMAGADTSNVAMVDTLSADTTKRAITTTVASTDTTKKVIKERTPATGAEGEKKSLLWLFLAALLGGIAAVITPCVYSMIPITVSFFTKRSKTRAEGIRNAIYYSLSIIIIFTVLGVLISVLFGANALNNLSTNWIANLFFFLVFLIFGISFLGAFEITLPSSWTSKTDSKAGLRSFGRYLLYGAYAGDRFVLVHRAYRWSAAGTGG